MELEGKSARLTQSKEWPPKAHGQVEKGGEEAWRGVEDTPHTLALCSCCPGVPSTSSSHRPRREQEIHCSPAGQEFRGQWCSGPTQAPPGTQLTGGRLLPPAPHPILAEGRTTSQSCFLSQMPMASFSTAPQRYPCSPRLRFPPGQLPWLPNWSSRVQPLSSQQWPHRAP